MIIWLVCENVCINYCKIEGVLKAFCDNNKFAIYLLCGPRINTIFLLFNPFLSIFLLCLVYLTFLFCV